MKLKILAKSFFIPVIIILLFISSLPCFASDTTLAKWTGIISISNNSTASQNVTANFTFNTESAIAQGMLNASANDCAVLYGGSDVAFMPGYSSNPWIVYISSIGSQSQLGYNFYCKDVTGGKIRYFPGSTGMTVVDDNSLEMGIDGSISWTGLFNGLAAGYLFSKPDAVWVYGNGSGNVSIQLPVNTDATFQPNAAGDLTQLVPSAGANWQCVSDNNDGTFVTTGVGAWRGDLYSFDDHTTESGVITSVTVWMRMSSSNGLNYFFRPTWKIGGNSYNGTQQTQNNLAPANYTEVFTTSPNTGLAWTWTELDSAQCGIWINEGGNGNAYCTDMSYVVNYKKPTSFINLPAMLSGEYDFDLQYDFPFLILGIDTDYVIPTSDNVVLNTPLWQTEFNSANFTTIDTNAIPGGVVNAVWSFNGYVFDGTDDVINFGSPAVLDDIGTVGDYKFTIEAWVNPAGLGENNYGRIVDKTNGVNNGFYICLRSNETIYFLVYSGGVLKAVQAPDHSVPLGTWSHIIAQYDGTILKLKINNGAWITGQAVAGAIDAHTADSFLIGDNSASSRCFDGEIGEVRVYNRALSETEIEQNYNATRHLYQDGYSSVYSYAGGIDDSTYDLVFAADNTMTYIESMAVTANSTTTGNWTWTYSTTFPDLSGYGNTATPSFRTTCNDSDVTAVLSSFQPSAYARSTYSPGTTNGTLTAITAPSQMYYEGDYSHLIGAEAINDILDASGTPRELWWYPFIFIGIGIFGMLIFGATKGTGGEGSILTQCIVCDVLLFLFGIMGPLMLWPGILFWVPATAIMISRKHYGYG